MKNNCYSEVFIDKSNYRRLYFFAEVSKLLAMYKSTSEEINDLVYWLWLLSNNFYEYESQFINVNYNYDLKSDRQVDENTFVRNVWNQDLRMYFIVAAICEDSSWGVRDILYDISHRIYKKLDDIIYPDYKPEVDYEEVRYYVEVEYISKEKQKEIKEEYSLDFKKEN